MPLALDDRVSSVTPSFCCKHGEKVDLLVARLVELLHVDDDGVEGGEPGDELDLDRLEGRSELLVERDAVRARLHSELSIRTVVSSRIISARTARRGTDAEKGLDDKAVELLERGLVRLGEADGELLALVGLAARECDLGELEPAEQPEEALGRRALLLALLVVDERLERRGLGRRREEARADFLLGRRARRGVEARRGSARGRVGRVFGWGLEMSVRRRCRSCRSGRC